MDGMASRWMSAAVVVGLALASASALAAGHPELKAFPPAGEGMQRFVIVLPDESARGEDNLKVELIVGKEMLTDAVNQVRLGASIERRTVEGWGYDYYEVVGSDLTVSTLMAAPEGAPQEKRFVTAAPLLVRYNSRLPIVVYAPAGYELRYRIWSAGDATLSAEIG